MATTFDRWQKDSFFAAAEEVQDSADRLESIYRQWIQERKESRGDFVDGEVERELRTALGTAKWQLEELDRAVRMNDEAVSAGEETRSRHSEFVVAIGDRILEVENSLKELNYGSGRNKLNWVQLDENERDELAHFLSCDQQDEDEDFPVSAGSFQGSDNLIGMNVEMLPIYASRNSSQLDESNLLETREKRVQAHCRAASTAGDIGAWMVAINSEGEDTSERSSGEQPSHLPPRVCSLSALTSAIESPKRMGWHKIGFRKWRGCHQHDLAETIPLRNNNFSVGINACYERSKSCLSNCGEDNYDKQLNGYVGAFRRLLQRYQYQLQYARPIHYLLWGTFAIFLIVLYVLHVS